MIVIESSALLTIGVAIVSVIVSVAATWYFAKRHYSTIEEPITAQQIELEMFKTTSRTFLTIVIVAATTSVVGLGLVGLITLLGQSA